MAFLSRKRTPSVNFVEILFTPTKFSEDVPYVLPTSLLSIKILYYQLWMPTGQTGNLGAPAARLAGEGWEGSFFIPSKSSWSFSQWKSNQLFIWNQTKWRQRRCNVAQNGGSKSNCTEGEWKQQSCNDHISCREFHSHFSLHHYGLLGGDDSLQKIGLMRQLSGGN